MSAVTGPTTSFQHSALGVLLKPSVMFAVVWIVLPNLPFMVFWALGGPPRHGFVFLYYGIGILGTLIGMRMLATLLVLLVLADVLFVLSLLFNIGPVSLLEVADQIQRMDILASATYLGAILAVLCTTSVVIFLASRYQSIWRKLSLVPVTLVALAFACTDYLLQSTATYKFGNYLSANAPFESAVSDSQLRAVPGDARTPSLFIVMVESWGAIRDERISRLSTQPLRSLALLERYEVQQGTTAYYGSTTNAELRELCGLWGNYKTWLEQPQSLCIPEQWRAAGFKTTAFHGFSRTMFEREQWYPNIGFAKTLFQEDLRPAEHPTCHTIFPGICDSDIFADVRRQLLDGGDQPQLVYWLTLDSHLPVHPALVKDQAACDKDTVYRSQNVCMLAQLWKQIFFNVAEIASDPQLAPTDVLLVGDHVPPFWKRSERSMFDPGRVPWLLLQSKRQRSDVRGAARSETSIEL